MNIKPLTISFILLSLSFMASAQISTVAGQEEVKATATATAKKPCASCEVINKIFVATSVFSGLEYVLYKAGIKSKGPTFSIIKTYYSTKCATDLYQAIEDKARLAMTVSVRNQNALNSPGDFVESAWSEFNIHRQQAVAKSWPTDLLPALVKDKWGGVHKNAGSIGDFVELATRKFLSPGHKETDENKFKAVKSYLCDNAVQKLVQKMLFVKKPSPLAILLPINKTLGVIKGSAEKAELYSNILQKGSHEILPIANDLGRELSVSLMSNSLNWTGHQMGKAKEIRALIRQLMSMTVNSQTQRPSANSVNKVIKDISQKTKNFEQGDPMRRYGEFLQGLVKGIKSP